MPKSTYLSSAKYFSWYVYVTLLHMYPTFISLFFLKILSKLRYVRISMKCNIFSFSWFWWKIMSKSAYVWILNTRSRQKQSKLHRRCWPPPAGGGRLSGKYFDKHIRSQYFCYHSKEKVWADVLNTHNTTIRPTKKI